MENLILSSSDPQHPAYTGAKNADSVLHVRFYKKATSNNFLTEKEGRPIFQDEIFIRIASPGDDMNVVDRIAEEHDKLRFPFHWQRYVNSQGTDESVVGTPLAQWPAITQSQAEELRGLKFYTVEAVAGCSDSQKQALGMAGNMLVQKAKAYIANAKDGALAQQQAAELQKMKDEQASKDSAHAAELADLRKMVESLAAEKPKRGRPPKQTEAA